MCLPIDRRGFRSAALSAAAAIALLVSFALPYAIHPAGQVERNWLHAVCGFFAGISIGMNLLSIRRGRNHRLLKF
jgi:hypothetical protein